MAAREVKRTLTVTADTSGLRKGAQDIQQFGQGADSAAAYLKRMRAELSATDYRSLAAGLKPVIAAEKEMAAMAREAERALKPFAAEMRKTQMEALKAAETLNNRRLSEAKAAEALRKTYDTGYRNAQAYLRVEEQVARQIEARNLTVEQGSVVLAGAATRFKQMGNSAGAANQNVRLTANQMQGLGYQLNDIGTMVALGASPFQVIASQAGQVVQVLGDGPQGMKGSLSAIGASLAGFARAIPAAGYVVAGV
ncbi:phage tail length tape measure family protein, partial [Aureimonas sp. AU4]|uniref:phage tail length tape measure family protein n=1 Tax=Aureimonas sp. AU4 TaxID=1638163 RepID=UPI00178CB227